VSRKAGFPSTGGGGGSRRRMLLGTRAPAGAAGGGGSGRSRAGRAAARGLAAGEDEGDDAREEGRKGPAESHGHRSSSAPGRESADGNPPDGTWQRRASSSTPAPYVRARLRQPRDGLLPWSAIWSDSLIVAIRFSLAGAHGLDVEDAALHLLADRAVGAPQVLGVAGQSSLVRSLASRTAVAASGRALDRDRPGELLLPERARCSRASS
jgi:hypothetical protein